MLYLFIGNDREKILEKLEATIESLSPETPLTLERFDAESFTALCIDEYAGAAGLFGERYGIVLEGVLGAHEEEILARAQVMGESSSTFFLIEEKILAKQRKILAGYAQNTFEASRTGKRREFPFLLTDALGKRDKKNLWVHFARLRKAGEDPESLCGVLFWMVKAMRAASVSKSASEAGLSPFVYTKAKNFAKNFSIEELEELSRTLVERYHEAHRGGMELDVALERFVLSI